MSARISIAYKAITSISFEMLNVFPNFSNMQPNNKFKEGLGSFKEGGYIERVCYRYISRDSEYASRYHPFSPTVVGPLVPTSRPFPHS